MVVYYAASNIAAKRSRTESSLSMASDGSGKDPVSPAHSQTRRNSFVSEHNWTEILHAQGLVDSHADDYLDAFPKRFHTIIGILVLSNALYIGIDADVSNRSGMESTKAALVVCDHVFCVAWLLEMVIRLKVQGCRRYFHDRFNILDFLLVWQGVFTTWVTPFMSAKTLRSDVGPMSLESLLTLLRILKLLRLIKLMRMFKKVWILVSGFVGASRTLGWVVLLLFGVTYAMAVVSTVLIGHSCSQDFPAWEQCDEHFGSVVQSMFTMFQVMTFESWSTQIARPVLSQRPELIIFFLIFFACTSFGLINVVVGVVVENTLQAADEQRRAELELQEKRARKELTTLRTVFEQADEDGSGFVDRSEFCEIMSHPGVKTKLKELCIPCEYPEKLFECLDEDESGEITIEEFIDGAMKLKADPSSSDMRTMVMQVSLIVNKVQRLDSITSAIATELGLVVNLDGEREKARSEAGTSDEDTTSNHSGGSRVGKRLSRLPGVAKRLSARAGRLRPQQPYLSRVSEGNEISPCSSVAEGGSPRQSPRTAPLEARDFASPSPTGSDGATARESPPTTPSAAMDVTVTVNGAPLAPAGATGSGPSDPSSSTAVRPALSQGSGGSPRDGRLARTVSWDDAETAAAAEAAAAAKAAEAGEAAEAAEAGEAGTTLEGAVGEFVARGAGAVPVVSPALSSADAELLHGPLARRPQTLTDLAVATTSGTSVQATRSKGSTASPGPLVGPQPSQTSAARRPRILSGDSDWSQRSPRIKGAAVSRASGSVSLAARLTLLERNMAQCLEQMGRVTGIQEQTARGPSLSASGAGLWTPMYSSAPPLSAGDFSRVNAMNAVPSPPPLDKPAVGAAVPEPLGDEGPTMLK